MYAVKLAHLFFSDIAMLNRVVFYASHFIHTALPSWMKVSVRTCPGLSGRMPDE